MASRGSKETALLKDNIEGQLKRLLTQLQDIEAMKDEFDSEEEYQSTREETVEQLREFEASLQRMTDGNMSLVDEIGTVQLAIQSAIRSANSPEILSMFLKKENGALRTKLSAIESDFRLGKLSPQSYRSQALEIIQMLDKLKEPLSVVERELLRESTKNMSGFERASGEVDSKIIEDASREIENKK